MLSYQVSSGLLVNTQPRLTESNTLTGGRANKERSGPRTWKSRLSLQYWTLVERHFKQALHHIRHLFHLAVRSPIGLIGECVFFQLPQIEWNIEVQGWRHCRTYSADWILFSSNNVRTLPTAAGDAKERTLRVALPAFCLLSCYSWWLIYLSGGHFHCDRWLQCTGLLVLTLGRCRYALDIVWYMHSPVSSYPVRG